MRIYIMKISYYIRKGEFNDNLKPVFHVSNNNKNNNKKERKN